MIRILFSVWLVLQASPALSQSNAACDSMVYIQNAKASLGIRVLGAAITDFRLAGSALNPFTWQVPLADMPVNNRAGAPFRGHFLCLGRWGAPTAGEMAAGMPHNGEAGNKCWEPGVHTNPLQLNMQVRAPMDGMEVKRQVWMDPQSPVVKVTEEVTSISTFARPFNMVQHSTIGPPFLDTTTLVDCNAAEGFLQSMSYPDPHRYSYRWPNGIRDSAGTPLDLTRSNEQFSYVSTHIFRDSLGWITALHPKHSMLVGYVWLVRDYPWVNVWQQWQGGKLWAKGLEFGTTGIGKSYQDLLATDTRFHGVPSMVLLDAGEKISKSYLMFTVAVPPGFQGVGSLQYNSNHIVIHEKSGEKRLIRIPTTISLQ